MAQAATYLAIAPKSNAAYLAIDAAMDDVRHRRLLPVPKHLQDKHYAGAKRLGHGEGYQYPHDAPDGWIAQDYLGVDRKYYQPTDRGFEAELQQPACRMAGANSRAEIVKQRVQDSSSHEIRCDGRNRHLYFTPVVSKKIAAS